MARCFGLLEQLGAVSRILVASILNESQIGGGFSVDHSSFQLERKAVGITSSLITVSNSMAIRSAVPDMWSFNRVIALLLFSELPDVPTDSEFIALL